MARRFKIRFPTGEAAAAARAAPVPGLDAVVRNPKRNYIAVEVPDAPLAATGAEAMGRDTDSGLSLRVLAERYGAEVVEDFRYDPETDADATAEALFGAALAATDAEASLDDVTAMIGADAVWAEATGAGAVIAIVNSGIEGSHPEFPAAKRAGQWAPEGQDAWTDTNGHGTMCATIAAASDAAEGARYRGVAPDARLISCKTSYYDSELAAIYDFLIDTAADSPVPLIVSNSLGNAVATPPPPPRDADFPDALADAVAAGLLVLFSAGNYHLVAGGAAGDCHPTTIWLHKCRADVLAVAACDLEGAMWFYSSRGPGQHFGDPGMGQKPDLTGPTPRNGRILYGAGERVLPNGWATSGACPQAAGLAALMLGLDPALDRQTAFGIIRGSAGDLGHAVNCQGQGLVDCVAAIDRVKARLIG